MGFSGSKGATMPTWTKEQLADYERKRANQIGGLPSSPQPQRAVRNEPLAEIPRAHGHGQRYAVVITSVRTRLLDPDNLCGKWFIDGLRHAGLIPDDTAAIVDYTICQKKAASKECQRTEIEIIPL